MPTRPSSGAPLPNPPPNPDIQPIKASSLISTPANSRLSSVGASANKRQRQVSGSSVGSVQPSSQVTKNGTKKRRSPLRPVKVPKRTIFKPPSKTSKVPSQLPSSAVSKTTPGAADHEVAKNQRPLPSYDFDQDSDIEIEEIKNKSCRQTTTAEDGNDKDNFSYDPKNLLLNFKCKWCCVTYRIHETLWANLCTHRDGSSQLSKNTKGCKHRAKVIAAGHQLPETVAARVAWEAKENLDSNQKTLNGFVMTGKLNFRVLNQLIVLWQMRQALPWSCIEDPYLRAVFLYANKDAHLYPCWWSADEAKQVYAVLRTKVFDELKVGPPLHSSASSESVLILCDRSLHRNLIPISHSSTMSGQLRGAGLRSSELLSRT
ncbi:hypothetical protein H4Q26_011064 [Puccinia striiformis f. sp. tritici PST-130]|nr:hypothetical protein H4Q26_011064 [Puccinia striiformis f. sp. tritici PST-130]